jgi:CubicO group peptidase (beta-lactamase class C family)
MRDTGFVARDAARVAVAYADGKPEPIRMRDGERVAFGPGDGISYAPSRAFDAASYASGGAGMIGSADDFLVFLEALRTGKPAILKPATLAAMKSSQIGDLDVDASGPGWGFGYGFAVLIDPRAANTPQSAGTFTWGGAYGHSWFVDPERRLTVVALTDTAVEGMSGQFPTAIRDAVYAASNAPAPERR